MDAKWKTKWIEALRSGDYEQGTGYLHDGNQFCCLGVLTDLVIKETADAGWVDINPQLEDQIYSAATLPPFVSDAAGLSHYDPTIKGKLLSTWNDVKGFTFEQIADLIEEGL